MAGYDRFVKSRLIIALCVLCLRVPMDKTYDRFEKIQKKAYDLPPGILSIAKKIAKNDTPEFSHLRAYLTGYRKVMEGL